MRILIVGAGVIGTIYRWVFSEGGHDVSHFVRPGKSARFFAGIPIDMLDNRKGHKKQFVGRYGLKVTETLAPSDDFDLVIVPTKPYQLEEALRQTVANTGSADYLLLTQNWHGTANIDAILPRSRYLYGDAKAGGTFRDSTLIAAIFPSIDLGRVDGKQGDCLKKAATLFEGVGMKPILHENILHYIWVQYAINAGLWPALVRAGGLEALLRDRRTGDLSLFAVKECLEVVARRGVDLKKYPDARMYANTSFIARQIAGLMLRLLFRFNKSVQRGSAHALADPLEIKTSCYDLLNTGRELGVDMPIMNSFENDIIRFAGPRRN
jgi:2-dehydropantoate 2-reductase